MEVSCSRRTISWLYLTTFLASCRSFILSNPMTSTSRTNLMSFGSTYYEILMIAGFKRPPCTTTNDSGSLTSDKPNNE